MSRRVLVLHVQAKNECASLRKEALHPESVVHARLDTSQTHACIPPYRVVIAGRTGCEMWTIVQGQQSTEIAAERECHEKLALFMFSFSSFISFFHSSSFFASLLPHFLVEISESARCFSSPCRNPQ